MTVRDRMKRLFGSFNFVPDLGVFGEIIAEVFKKFAFGADVRREGDRGIFEEVRLDQFERGRVGGVVAGPLHVFSSRGRLQKAVAARFGKTKRMGAKIYFFGHCSRDGISLVAGFIFIP
jgi:hypothetical protein